mgnify:CR=1 FL=1
MSFTGKAALASAAQIKNDGFWPELELGDLLEKYRIPAEYENGVIETGLIMAMIRTNDSLNAVKLAVIALGHANLSAYTTANVDLMDDQPVLNHHYQHAVFCKAKAELLPQLNSLNRKPNAENAAKESDEQQQYWLDQAQSSIKSIFKKVLPDDTTVSSMANVHISLL